MAGQGLLDVFPNFGAGLIDFVWNASRAAVYRISLNTLVLSSGYGFGLNVARAGQLERSRCKCGEMSIMECEEQAGKSEAVGWKDLTPGPFPLGKGGLPPLFGGGPGWGSGGDA